MALIAILVSVESGGYGQRHAAAYRAVTVCATLLGSCRGDDFMRLVVELHVELIFRPLLKFRETLERGLLEAQVRRLRVADHAHGKVTGGGDELGQVTRSAGLVTGQGRLRRILPTPVAVRAV